MRFLKHASNTPFSGLPLTMFNVTSSTNLLPVQAREGALSAASGSGHGAELPLETQLGVLNSDACGVPAAPPSRGG